MDAFAYCADLVRDADKDRFLSSLFASMENRPALHALYAFDVETRTIAFRVREPMAGEVRLQWWRDVLAGERKEEARANPVAAALLLTLDAARLPREPLATLIDARAGELYADPPGSLAAVENAGRNTAGMIFWIAAQILDPRAEAAAEELVGCAGAAAGIVHALTTLPVYRARGTFALPVDLLERHGARPDDALAGRLTPALGVVLAEMRAAARCHLEAVRRELPLTSLAVRPAFLHVMLLPLVLDRMERRGHDPFATVIDLPQWRRQWRLWRAARGL